MLENLILKKSKISGVAQNGSIFANWIFRVANFRFNYLRHFVNNLANSFAHLVANFLNFSKHPLTKIIWWFWRELWTKNKKIRHWKICHFEPTLKGGITLRVHLTPERPRNLIFSQFECKWMRLGISWKKSIFLLSGSPTIMHYMGDVKWSNPGFPVWVSAAHQTQNRIFTQKYCLAFWTEWWEINVCGVPES